MNRAIRRLTLSARGDRRGGTSPAADGTGAQEAPPIVAPPAGNPRFPLLDSVRALAAISILVVHTAILGGVLEDAWYRPLVAHLDIGVTIFFLLSGFLLYRPLVAARILGSPSSRIRDYARRRFLRIAPAYWVALTVVAVVPGLYGIFGGNWWVYYGLLQNYPVYTPTGGCATAPLRCGIAPTWTLAVEVGFYAALPFFAVGMARLTARLRGGRWLVAELAVLAVVAAASVLIQGSDVDSDLTQWLFFSPLGLAWWFGLGMALAAVSVRVAERGLEPPALRWLGNHPGAPWAAAIVLYVTVSLFVLEPVPALVTRVFISKIEYVGGYLLTGLIAVLILLPAIFGDRRGGLPRRIMGHRVLAWLGLVSYGIFLWHYPVLLGLVDLGVTRWWPQMTFPLLAATCLAITVACASVSYYVVERPLMRLKYRRLRPPGQAQGGARSGHVPAEAAPEGTVSRTA